MNWKELQKTIQKKFPEMEIHNHRSISGGDINMAACLETNKDKLFIKWNNANTFPKMFEKETKGLELLNAHSPTLRIPKPLLTGTIENKSFLILEYIESGSPEKDFWKNFAFGLATIHKSSEPYFGLDYNNYMGSLIQSNKKHLSFHDFFISERLEPQIKLAYDNNLINETEKNKIKQVYNRYETDVPRENPSLIHGDLWSGNYMADNQGNACIFDPAAHYGHRESDIAMSRLFGSFSQEFYHYYNEFFPLESGWQSRTDLFNLYPLLIHVNLFGNSYLSSVMSIVNQFR